MSEYMKKLCIAPFTSREISVAASLEDNYVIVSVASPQGIGIDGRDIGLLKNRENFGIYCESNLEEAIGKCDTVFISDCSERLRFYAIEAIEVAIKYQKDILCFLSLSEASQKDYINRCIIAGISFTSLGVIDISMIEMINYKYKRPNLPVIYIGEIVENCDGNEIYFKVLNYFTRKNKVLGLSNNKYSHMFGQVPVNFFSGVTPEESVMKLNYYINQYIDDFQTDVIIVKLPKPIMQFSDYIHYDFGISTHMIASAIPADYLLICTPLNVISSELLDVLNDGLKYKINVEITGVHVGNQMIDNSYEDVDGVYELAYDRFINSLTCADKLKRNGYVAENFTVEDSLYKILDGISSEIFMLPYGVI